MQVENIECQIAQAQIGNFLAGSGLSDEAITQLEEHIAGCAHCKAALADKRNELKALLNPERAVVDFEAIHREAKSLQAKSISTALRKKSLQQLVEPEATPEPTKEPELDYASIAAYLEAKKKAEAPTSKVKSASYWKPLAYSLGLGAVLVGMSLFSDNIASIFGPKANEGSLSQATGLPTRSPEKLLSGQATASTAATDTPNTDLLSGQVNGKVTNPIAATPTSEDQTTGTTSANPPSPIVPIEHASSLGSTLGALATTQFQSPEADPIVTPTPTKAPEKVVTKPTPTVKPVVKKSPSRSIARRASIRRPVRKAAVRRPAVRSRGIKVYQP